MFIYHKAPDPPVLVACDAFEHMVVIGGVREGDGPALFNQIGPQVLALGKTGGAAVADRVETPVLVLALLDAAHEALDLEIERQDSARSATDGILEGATLLVAGRDMDAVEVEDMALDQEAAVLLDQGITIKLSCLERAEGEQGGEEDPGRELSHGGSGGG